MATGDETIVLTSEVDKRGKPPDTEMYPVWEKVATATHDDDDIGDVTLAITMNGIIQEIVFKVPNYTNAITGQLQIKDNGDNVIFDSGEQVKNATYTFSVHKPVSGTIDVVMGVSGAAGGTGGDMVATLRGI